MYRTFNMGCGMIVAVEAEHAQAICKWLSERLTGVAIIGSVNDAGHKVTHAIEGVEFSHY
jgi:phosphoribosylaminoimidazole (AIR) synthetase